MLALALALVAELPHARVDGALLVSLHVVGREERLHRALHVHQVVAFLLVAILADLRDVRRQVRHPLRHARQLLLAVLDVAALRVIVLDQVLRKVRRLLQADLVHLEKVLARRKLKAAPFLLQFLRRVLRFELCTLQSRRLRLTTLLALDPRSRTLVLGIGLVERLLQVAAHVVLQERLQREQHDLVHVLQLVLLRLRHVLDDDGELEERRADLRLRGHEVCAQLLHGVGERVLGLYVLFATVHHLLHAGHQLLQLSLVIIQALVDFQDFPAQRLHAQLIRGRRR